MQNQTILKELSKLFPEEKLLKTIANNCCCSMVALWIMGIDDLIASVEIIKTEMQKGGLDQECTVQWLPFFKHITGRDIYVEFRDIKSLEDLKDVKGRCAVKFEYGKQEHWIGVENRTIAFNSMDLSKTVANGEPTTARIIRFK